MTFTLGSYTIKMFPSDTLEMRVFIRDEPAAQLGFGQMGGPHLSDMAICQPTAHAFKSFQIVSHMSSFYSSYESFYDRRASHLKHETISTRYVLTPFVPFAHMMIRTITWKA